MQLAKCDCISSDDHQAEAVLSARGLWLMSCVLSFASDK